MNPGSSPAPGAVHVWRILLARPAGGWLALLDPAERSRATALPAGESRRRFVVCHASVRQILARYVGGAPGDLRFTTGRHGKPRLTARGPGFSLSHSGDLAVLAVTPDRHIGIDIEVLRPRPAAAAIAARYFPHNEARLVAAATTKRQAAVFAMLWTRKEACVKAAGGRLVQGLCLPVGAANGVVRDATGALGGPWTVRDLGVAPGYAGAVVIAGTDAPAITCYRWPAETSLPLSAS